MGRRLFAIAVVLTALLAAAGTAHATLSPQAYEMIRSRAPVAFGGVVVGDRGGRMDVRVEQVRRGPVRPGMIVPVTYPEDRGVAPPPGPAVYYRRFQPGDRLLLWGDGSPVLHVVDGGIDLVHRANTPAKSGGCGACAVGAVPSPPAPAGIGALLLCGLATHRRRRRAPR
jgi:MYXO-CTERM domain-containing protein